MLCKKGKIIKTIATCRIFVASPSCCTYSDVRKNSLRYAKIITSKLLDVQQKLGYKSKVKHFENTQQTFAAEVLCTNYLTKSTVPRT